MKKKSKPEKTPSWSATNAELIYFLQNVIIMNVFSVVSPFFAVVAQLVEHTLGKGEVTGPIPVNGSSWDSEAVKRMWL